MTKNCAHDRTAVKSMVKLEESLRRLQTDHLDLWQIHEVASPTTRTPFRPRRRGRGARESRKGKVRFVGFTGHKNPAIFRRMLSDGFPLDTLQMPVNGFDANFHSFQSEMMPIARSRGIAVIGMKSLGGDGRAVKTKTVRVEDALRYAMSLPVVSTISGIDSMRVLRQNLAIARGFQPMSTAQMSSYRRKASIDAMDGRFELYKTTAEHEGDEGRTHSTIFPTKEQVAG